jgi:AcrR family transcriptional regulator
MTDPAISESRVERRMRETRLRIQRAALELFATRGLDETTVAEITERADVGKGTFFTYFPSKVAVLTGVAAMLVEQMEAALADAADQPLPERLERLFAPALAWHQEHPEISRFLAVAFLRDAAYADADQENNARLFHLLSREVAAAQARGELTTDVPVEQAARTIFGVYFGALAAWHISKRGAPLRRYFLTSFQVVMRGLRP